MPSTMQADTPSGSSSGTKTTNKRRRSSSATAAAAVSSALSAVFRRDHNVHAHAHAAGPRPIADTSSNAADGGGRPTSTSSTRTAGAVDVGHDARRPTAAEAEAEAAAAACRPTTAIVAAAPAGRKKKGGGTTTTTTTITSSRIKAKARAKTATGTSRAGRARTPFRRGSAESLPSVCPSSASSRSWSGPFHSAASDQSGTGTGTGTGAGAAGSAEVEAEAGAGVSTNMEQTAHHTNVAAAAVRVAPGRVPNRTPRTRSAADHNQAEATTPDTANEAALSALSLQNQQHQQHHQQQQQQQQLLHHHHQQQQHNQQQQQGPVSETLQPPQPFNHAQSLRPPPPLPPIPAERRRRRASASTSAPAEATAPTNTSTTSATAASTSAADNSNAEAPEQRQKQRQQQKQKQHEFHVDFHPMVMFATVPSKAEFSDDERSAMFWTGEEESNIRRTLKRQIQLIKTRRERKLHPQNNDGTRTSTSSATTTGDGSPDGPVPILNLAAIMEEEERTLRFCCRGLEHYLFPREERRVQTARQKSALQSVLDLQRWQLVRSNVGPMDDTSSIGAMFAEATSHSRTEALERAARDEAEARKVHTDEWTEYQ